LWRVSYLYRGEWTVLDEGQGGWIDSGIYEYDGRELDPIIADAMRIQVFSDGTNDLVSIHLRGRGGISTRVNDSGTTPKATLFMFLPQEGTPEADFDFVKNQLTVDFDANATIDDGSIVSYQWNFGDGTTSMTGPLDSHTYAAPGLYQVTLTVTDDEGLSDTVSKNISVTDGAVNDPNSNVNLALLDDATLSGSVSDGRGTPLAILYDPLIDDYRLRTDWNEYGVPYLENLGRPTVDNGFKWQVDWDSTKLINYVTIGGTYDNQPQYGALWRISYLKNGEWIILDEGLAGWINSGIFEWDGRDGAPIEADAFRVQVYSDGNSDLISIHLRGRGGISNRVNDSAEDTKATLIQYLPPAVPPATGRIVEDLNSMQISPNPSSGRALVSFSELTDIQAIAIYDLSGRRVQDIRGGKIDKEGKRISVHGLPQGIYTVIATTTSGKQYQEKLIVKK
jgi:PKD repeat protein